MGSLSLTKTENDKLRVLVNRAVASGDYTSFNELGERTGIGGTTLYPFMRRKSGLSRPSAIAIMPYLKKYDRPRAERSLGVKITASNGHSNGKANGHTNGHANGKTNGATNGHAKHDGGKSKAELTKDVLLRLFDLRANTHDENVRAVIDEVTSNWALDGLHILATTANRADGVNALFASH